MKKTTLIASMLLTVGMGAHAAVYYATPGGGGTREGTSWDNALAGADIVGVLNGLAEGDVLYLCEGVYTATGEGKARPVAGITVVGGFPATATGTDLSGYNPWALTTTLDAAGLNGTEAFIRVDLSDDARNVLTTFKGLRFTGATGDPATSSNTGTVLNCTHAYILMEDCTFDGNTSYKGGIIVPYCSNFHAKHCVWVNNKNVSTATSGSTFQSVLTGRGTSSSICNIVLEGCVMVNNSIANDASRAAAAYGGDMNMQDSSVSLAMVNCYADGGGQTIKQNGGFLRMGKGVDGSSSVSSFFAFNTICNYRTASATDVRGHIISLNSYAPTFMLGNLLITDDLATADNDAAHHALYIQSWGSSSMAALTSGGYNSVTGSYLASTTDCTLRTQHATDNWLAPTLADVFGGNATTAKSGRYCLEPVAAYADVDLAAALAAYEGYKLPECFAWADVDLAVDLFGNKRASTTYRGAYDPNATPAPTTGIAEAGVDAEAGAPCEYYNLQGIRVANPSGGIYIVRQGHRVSKVAR